MKNQKLLKAISKGIAVINGLAIFMVVNNVNVTCAWIWGQPKISENIVKKYKQK